MRRSRSTTLAGSAAAVALAAGALSLSTANSTTPPVTADPAAPISDGPLMASIDPSVRTSSPASEVDPSAKAAFALLRRSPTGMPADVARQVASPLAYGRNAALAHTIDTPTGPGYVIPGRGYVCIAVPDPVDGFGTTCQPTAVAARQGISIEMGLPKDQVEHTALVPDGATVHAVESNGTRKAVGTDSAGVASRVMASNSDLSVSVK